MWFIIIIIISSSSSKYLFTYKAKTRENLYS